MGWTTPPSQFAVNVRESIEPTQKRMAVDLVTNLTKNTPVDTGRARANWFTTVGKPSKQQLYLSSKREKSVQSGEGTKAIQKAENLRLPKTGELIFISNNLPYIVYLDKGTDKIESFNIVEKSLRATANRVGWEI